MFLFHHNRSVTLPIQSLSRFSTDTTKLLPIHIQEWEILLQNTPKNDKPAEIRGTQMLYELSKLTQEGCE